MRSKFTELIEKGVASRSYTNVNSDLPTTDPICRLYNNLFSIASDTHMSLLPDGRRVITGHMVNTPNWDKFITSPFWGGMKFSYNNDFWSLSDLLFKQGLHGYKSILNGDVVYMIEDIPATETVEAGHIMTTKDLADMTRSYTTSESQIPHPVVELTTNGDVNTFKECLQADSLNQVVENLNQSLYIKGNQWSVSESKIVGLIGETVIKLN